MKYAVVILGGAADKPLDDLQGLTPLQAANTPAMDELTRLGRLGTVTTCPQAFRPDDDVCTFALLGSDPSATYPGRAPLEAIAQQIHLGPDDWALCGSLMTLDENGRVLDPTAGTISSVETRSVLQSIANTMAEQLGSASSGIEFVPGRGHRCLFIDRTGRTYEGIETIPPYEIPGMLVSRHRPRGSKPGQFLTEIIELSHEVLADHAVNLTRRDMGEHEATDLWLWGEGQKRSAQSFADQFDRRAAMISSIDAILGVAHARGMHTIDAPSTGDLPKRLVAEMGREAILALGSHDVVCVFAGDPGEAGHFGDFSGKVDAITAIDEGIVAPLLDRLRDDFEDQWRMLIVPSHAVLAESRIADHLPCPFVMAGRDVTSIVPHNHFSEPTATESDLHIDEAANLMEYFLFSGLSGRRRG